MLQPGLQLGLFKACVYLQLQLKARGFRQIKATTKKTTNVTKIPGPLSLLFKSCVGFEFRITKDGTQQSQLISLYC